MPCRLIINADDLGWSEGVNEAVSRLYDAGIVTSASLMVGAPAAADGVARARARPGLALGLHLALVYSPALLPPAAVPHLVDRDGWFTRNCIRAAARYTLLPACRHELRAEMEAQFRTFAALGLGWSHVDSHVHLSLTPVVFRMMLELCSGYPVIGIRVPEDDYLAYCRVDPLDSTRQAPLALHFALCCRLQRRLLRSRPYVVPRRCYGLFRTGRLDAQYLARLVGELPDGDYELHCHPDVSTAAGCGELEALSSAAFRRALSARGVVLSTYASLQGKRIAGERSQGRPPGKPGG